MATLVSFWSLFGDRMADLGLIDSKLGLYIKINVNNGQNKFEVHISKNVAKMAILWPKIGQRHFGARASHGHNLAIFHQILTNEHTKMTSSLRRIEWNKILSSISLFYILVFWPHFCSEASHGQCCTYGLKTTLKLLVHVLAIMASSYLKIVFLQKSGLNPPLNQAGRNNYPYNPKFVGNTGNQTRDLWLDKCISNQQLYHLTYSASAIKYFMTCIFPAHYSMTREPLYIEEPSLSLPAGTNTTSALPDPPKMYQPHHLALSDGAGAGARVARSEDG